MSDKISAEAPMTTERDAPQECRVGALDGSSEIVELRELAESPQRFEGLSVKVTGYVLDLYELASITDGSGRYAVSANWGKLDIRPCRRRRVIAEGVFRSVPHSRFKHALQVKALLDAQSVDAVKDSALPAQGTGEQNRTQDGGTTAPANPETR